MSSGNPNLKCYCTCPVDDCASFYKPTPQVFCRCIRQLSKSTKFIERVIDCADTIVRVLTICGIHQCKAKVAAEVIIFAFLHYDIVPDPVSSLLFKKLRKADVYHDLGRKCRMNRVESHLAYCIIKRAFKAFYFKQTSDSYNPDFIDEFQWMQAAKKTAEAYAKYENLTDPQWRKLENRIKCAYCSYIERIYEARRKEEYGGQVCPCVSGQPAEIEKNRALQKEKEKEEKKIIAFTKRLVEEGKKTVCAPPDPCGMRLLEEQTQSKEGKTTACKCGFGECLCRCIKECGKVCADFPQQEDGIAIDWACMPGPDGPPEQDCLPP